jgi:hypothetical protein
MRRLPKPPAELVGLPDWPLLLTKRAAASYLSLSAADFDKGVRHLELPGPRRTPGSPRGDLDVLARASHWELTPAIRERHGTRPGPEG